MNKIGRLRLCALFLFVPSLGLTADLADGIDRIVKDAGVGADTPGVAIAVIDKGKVVFRKGYGLARLDDKAAMTTKTTCEIASMTKMFTAAATMVLHDQGKLSLDDPVRKHIPELPEYYDDKKVTIAHLLQHTSGLPDYLQFPRPKGKDAGFVTSADYVGEFARLKDRFKVRFEPGQKHQYNNSNYMLLAVIIERVSKKSYGEFLREEVLRPLGMKESWVYEQSKSAPKVDAKNSLCAIGYSKQKDKWEAGWGCPPFRDEWLLAVGDGGLWTNIDELILWDAGLRAGKLVRAETMKRALERSRTDDKKTNNYGFGFSVAYQGDRLTAFGHGGAWVFRTTYLRDVVKDRSIIILSNRDGFPVESVRAKIDRLPAD